MAINTKLTRSPILPSVPRGEDLRKDERMVTFYKNLMQVVREGRESTYDDISVIRDAVDAMITSTPTYPKFSATMSAAQSIPTATWTKMNFDTEVYDVGSCYDTVNYRWTPGQLGYVQATVIGYYGAFADAAYLCFAVALNGNVYRQATFRAASSADEGSMVTFDIPITNVADYIEAFAYHDVGTSQTLSNSTNLTAFCGHMLP